MAEGMAGIIILLGIFLTIIWLILPFAVFGIKGQLDEIIKLMKEVNDNLKKKPL